MHEIWKDIPGYEGIYQASTLGRIKSLSRIVTYVTGRKVKTKELIISPSIVQNGYRVVSLFRDKRMKNYYLHRLILFTFCGAAPDGKGDGMHLDDDTANNGLSNLAWGSRSENTQQAFDRGRKVSPKYWQNRTGILNKDSKKVIQLNGKGEELLCFFSLSDASRATNIDTRVISRCAKSNVIYDGIGWKYAS